MTFKTHALVLGHRSFRESDRLYQLLTEHEGVLSVVVKGAGKSSSKLAGHLQRYGLVRVMIGRGRIDHLAGVLLEEDFPALRQSWFNFILCSTLVELIIRTSVPAGDRARVEYALVLKAFRMLAQPAMTRRRKVWISRIFFWNFMSILGWHPNFDQCAQCSNQLTHDIYFDTMHGFSCELHGRQGLVLRTDLLRFMERMLSADSWAELLDELDDNGSSFNSFWLEMSQKYYQQIVKQPLNSQRLLQYA